MLELDPHLQFYKSNSIESQNKVFLNNLPYYTKRSALYKPYEKKMQEFQLTNET